MMRTFLVLLAITSSVFAWNHDDRQGNNFFEVNGVKKFPIVWDVRDARMELSAFSYDYGGLLTDGYLLLDDILEGAEDAGFNGVLVRSELRDGLPITIVGSTFEETASVARDLGMYVFGGGFKTSLSTSAGDHNSSVITLLAEYKSTSQSQPGAFVGVTAFDEPDAHWENSDPVNDDWIDLVDDTGDDVSLQIGLPYGCFLDRYSTPPDPSAIQTFCSIMDTPIYDRYPCNNYDYTNFGISSQLQSFCATELLQNESDPYDTYSTQDEVIRVYDTSVHIYQFTNEQDPNGLEMEDIASFSPPSGTAPICYASSDYRTSDVGDRSTNEHNINGAVVLWRQNTNSNKVVYNHTRLITSSYLPMPGTSTGIIDCCVGQTNYPVVYPAAADREGVIGEGELRILACYGTADVNRVRIFKKDPSVTSGFLNIMTGSSHSLGLPSGFVPTASVWGAFWHDNGSSRIVAPESGFILYNSSGQYVTVYQTPPGDDETWVCSSLKSGLFSGIIGGIQGDMVFVSRSNLNNLPQWAAGRDYFCYLDNYSAETKHLLWYYGDSPADGLNLSGLTPVDFYGIAYSAGVDRAGYGWNQRADRLVIGTANGIYTSVEAIEFNSDPLTVELKSDPGVKVSEYMTSARVYNSRRPHRSALFTWRDGWNPPGVGHSVSVLDAQIAPSFSMANFFTEKNDVWQYGIDGTDKCMFANIQAYGRHGQENATYCPTLDELRYMVITSVLAGARGLQFYALDLAIASGTGGTVCGVSPSVVSIDPLMTNWGPSIDIRNANMVSRVHSIIEEFEPFANALVSNSYTTLNNSYVVQGTWDYGHFNPSSDNRTGFLALQSTTSDRIYVMLANYSGTTGYSNRVLYFPGEYNDDWTLTNVGGYEVSFVSGLDYDEQNMAISNSSYVCSDINATSIAHPVNSREKDVLTLMVNYSGMPAYESCFFYLDPVSSDETSVEEVHALSVYQSEDVQLAWEIQGDYNSADLSIYDLSGRMVDQVWNDANGSGYSGSVNIEPSHYSSGMYFAVLLVDDQVTSRKMNIIH